MYPASARSTENEGFLLSTSIGYALRGEVAIHEMASLDQPTHHCDLRPVDRTVSFARRQTGIYRIIFALTVHVRQRCQ